MSTTIDEKVVEMRFDNAQFEKNVSSTITWLDKLKASLRFDKTADNFKGIETASKNVNFSALQNGIEAVQAKFSALDIVAMRALSNITDRAMATGERLVKSLTVDNIASGWEKYNQKNDSVQTIMNATGKSIEEVNGYLDKLMWYSDETSYSFTDMTSSLGQLTAAGGDVDKLIPMIMGIANATAFAGKGAAEFQRSIYNLNQSYSAGSLQYMDWKSLTNAGTDSKQLKEVFIEEAKALGKLNEEGKTAKGTLVTIESFSKTLSEGWATSEVMEKAFGRFAKLTEAAYEAVDSGKYDTAAEAIEALADGYDKVASESFIAAQTARSFKDAIAATKDAVSSGWMRTFEIIFGDLNESKAIWTELTEWLWETFAAGAETRNKILTKALGKSQDAYGDFSNAIKKSGVSMEVFETELKKTAKEMGEDLEPLLDAYGSIEGIVKAGKLKGSIVVQTLKNIASSITTVSNTVTTAQTDLENLQNTVNRVIRGDFGNGAERVQKLTEAGQNYILVQRLVNKVWEKNDSTWKDTTITSQDLTEVINSMSEAELTNIGYTTEQAKSLKELAEESEKTGTDIYELIKQMERPSGKNLFFGSVRNVLSGITKVLKALKKSFNDIFYPNMSDDDIMTAKSEKLYKILEFIYNATSKLDFTDVQIKKISEAFRGLFSVLNLISIVFGRGVVLGFKALKEVLSWFDYTILDLLADIGYLLESATAWIKTNSKIASTLQAIKKFLKEGLIATGKLVKELQKIDLLEIAKEAIAGFVNGIREGINDVKEVASELANSFINRVKNVFDIHSPSRVMFKIGSFVISGLIAGIVKRSLELNLTADDMANGFIQAIFTMLQRGFKNIITIIQNFNEWIYKALVSTDWKDLTSKLAEKLGSIFSGLKEIIKAIAEHLGPVANTVSLGFIAKIFKELSGVISAINALQAALLKSQTKLNDAKAARERATALALIGVGVVLIVTSLAVVAGMDLVDIFKSVIVVGVILGALYLIFKLLTKIDKAVTLTSAKNIGILVVGLAAGLLLGAIALKTLSTFDFVPIIEKISKSLLAIAGLIFVYSVVTGIIEAIKNKTGNKTENGESKSGLGSMVLNIAKALLIMAALFTAMKIITDKDIRRGEEVIYAVGSMFLALMIIGGIVSFFAKDSAAKLGSMILDIAKAMQVMILLFASTKALSKQDVDEGIAIYWELTKMFSVLLLVGGLASLISGKEKDQSKLGGMIQHIATAMVELSAALIAIGLVSEDTINKGIAAMWNVTIMISVVLVASRAAKDVTTKSVAMITFLMLSMTGLIYMLSYIKVNNGTIAILALCILLIKAIEKMITKMNVSAFKPKKMKAANDTLLAISVLLLSIGFMVILISKAITDVTTAITITGMIVILLAAVTGVLKVVSTIKVEKISTIVTIVIAMIAILAAVTGLIYVISLISDKFGANLDSISKILISVSIVVAVMGLVLAGLLMIPMAGIAAAAKIALALDAFMGIIFAFFVTVAGILGGIGELTGGLDWLINGLKATVEVFKYIGMAIGDFVGGLIGGLFEGALEGITLGITFMIDTIGQSISKFPDNALSKAIEIGEVLLALSGAALAALPGSLSALIGGAGFNSLMDFSNNIGTFMYNIKKANVQPTDAAMVTLIGTMMASVVRSLAGASSKTLDKNISKLPTLGVAIGGFMMGFSKVKKVGKFTQKDCENVTMAAQAVTAIQNSLPREGGLAGAIFGEKQSIDEFGTNLIGLAKGLGKFINKVNEMEFNEDQVKKAKDIGELIASLYDALPRSGGIAQTIMGENMDLDSFGVQMARYAHGLGKFCTTIAEQNIDTKQAEKARDVGLAMSELIDNLPKSGGWLQKIVGESTDLSDFGTQMYGYASGLVAFCDAINNPAIRDANGNIIRTVTIDKDKADRAAAIGQSLAKIQSSLGTQYSGLSNLFVKNQDLSSFAKNMEDYGGGLVAYVSKISELNQGQLSKATGAITIGQDLANLANSIKDLNVVDLDTISGVILDYVLDMAKQLMDYVALNKEAGNIKFRDIGEMMAKQIAHGMKDAAKNSTFVSSDIKDTIAEFGYKVNSLLVPASDQADGFGLEIANLILKGINSVSASDVYDSAMQIFEAPINAYNDYKDQNGNNKFFTLGRSIVDQMAKGMDSYVFRVGITADDIMNQVFNSFTGGLSNIGDLNNLSLSPTITPVLDLNSVTGSRMTLSTALNDYIYNPIDALNSTIKAAKEDLIVSNNNVIRAINDLRSELYTYNNKPTPEFTLNVDGKKMASALAPGMNSALYKLSLRR